MPDSAKSGIPRIEALRVRNYRALRDLSLSDITPLTVLLGPNGSGKSTLFDVFAFLAECFSEGLVRAWEKRGRFRELRSRGAEGEIAIELTYRETEDSPLMTYCLTIDEVSEGPVVSKETLKEKSGKSENYLDFSNGRGRVRWEGDAGSGEESKEVSLTSSSVIAVGTLGQLEQTLRLSGLRKFVSGWYLSSLSASDMRGIRGAGPEKQLSQTGDNVPNVVQYLHEQHPEQLNRILDIMRARVPRFEEIRPGSLDEDRLVLLIKDAPFERPIPARFASDGTLKLFAYLIELYNPEPPPLIGLEEPENFLHPKLLRELAEECDQASERSQLLVTTHSPFFIDALQPRQVWVLFRGQDGYAQARRVSDMRGIGEFIEAGATLGELWTEGHFDVGDPRYPG
ncbi:MAG: AAA family ATPase [Alphaproteobacteria bacterium]|jgi:predicted ATPase|nr:AAA family ATPase [Alphaproteobacteria bacterium]